MVLFYHKSGKMGTGSLGIYRSGQPCILENNFEYSSERGIRVLLEKYRYSVLAITLTGDYQIMK
jgi:hypothetical protein